MSTTTLCNVANAAARGIEIGAPGENNARAFEVAGHPFFARKPS